MARAVCCGVEEVSASVSRRGKSKEEGRSALNSRILNQKVAKSETVAPVCQDATDFYESTTALLARVATWYFSKEL